MSWSVYAQVFTVEDLDSIELPATMQSEEHAAQFESVKEVVESLIDQGVIGTGPWAVTLSGHANEEFQPKEGWSDTSLTISLNENKQLKPVEQMIEDAVPQR